MKMKTIIASLLMLFVGLMNASAEDWSISAYVYGSQSKVEYTVTRSWSGGPQTVKYRSVSYSALAGKHFTEISGSITFDTGETEKMVTVQETAMDSVPLNYRYYGADKIYYRFEVADQSGAVLADYLRQIYIGSTNATYHLNPEGYYNSENPSEYACIYDGSLRTSGIKYHDVGYIPPTEDVETKGTLQGYVLIDDEYDYSRKPATVFPDPLFVANRAGGSGEYHKLLGNKLYAAVCFTEKEQNDGYAYVQILLGDANSPYDEGYDPNGEVNTPVKSIYKACFELKKGSDVYGGSGLQVFPHRYDYHNQAEEWDLGGRIRTAFWMEDSYLWMQKWKSTTYRDNDNINNNAFVLDPDCGPLTVRFDCGGSNNDTYGYKDLFVRWALYDQAAPTLMSDDIKVSPGLHAKGNRVTISIPFNEPIQVEYVLNDYVLNTSWGNFPLDLPNYGFGGLISSTGTNTLSFTGSITANAGTALSITGLSHGNANEVKDLMGNEFAGTVNKSFPSLTVDASYRITLNLGGGMVSDASNITSYTAKSDDITLINPTRQYYVFTGWTGTDLAEPTMTVTIPAGSTGDRTYTANWVPAPEPRWGSDNGADGTEAHPYIITTVEGMELLRYRCTNGERFRNIYFQLGCDLDMQGSGFNPIGLDSNGTGHDFDGSFNGRNHVIRNLDINRPNHNFVGLFAYVSSFASICNIVMDNATLVGKNNVGAVAGYCVGSGKIRDCLVLNSSVTGNDDVGPVFGEYTNAAQSNSYYHNCTVNGGSPSSTAFTIDAEPGIVVSGTAACASGGINYYKQGVGITLSPAPCYTLDNVVYTPAGGVETAPTDNGDGTFSFSMPDADVSVSASKSSTPAPANEATVGGQIRYCYTFYSSTTSYELEPGAQAFTMKSDKALYAIGDGRIVPAGTAVIIMTTKADVAMTATARTAIPESGNILQGTTETTSVASLSIPAGKKVYVMGQVSGNFGFFEYTGTTIPANKAYYVE